MWGGVVLGEREGWFVRVRLMCNNACDRLAFFRMIITSIIHLLGV